MAENMRHEVRHLSVHIIFDIVIIFWCAIYKLRGKGLIQDCCHVANDVTTGSKIKNRGLNYILRSRRDALNYVWKRSQ